MRFWAHQILVAIDQLINAFLGGWADETLSSRCYRQRHEGEQWFFLWTFLDMVFFWQLSHCLDAYNSEKLRLQSPVEER